MWAGCCCAFKVHCVHPSSNRHLSPVAAAAAGAPQSGGGQARGTLGEWPRAILNARCNSPGALHSLSLASCPAKRQEEGIRSSAMPRSLHRWMDKPNSFLPPSRRGAAFLRSFSGPPNCKGNARARTDATARRAATDAARPLDEPLPPPPAFFIDRKGARGKKFDPESRPPDSHQPRSRSWRRREHKTQS